jgi:N-acetylmuramoyl-L-alanine amidase
MRLGIVLNASGGFKEDSSFLKKKSKRLLFSGLRDADIYASGNKSFLVLFFKKELLSSFLGCVALEVFDLFSPNVDERPGGPSSVNILMLHYTGMQSAQAAIDRLRDPDAKVSSHYVVAEDGAVFRLVPEELRAFHAGISYWRGRRVLNDVSIGIEIVNPGHEWGYRAFPEAQMDAVRELCSGIVSRHAIAARNVVGHSDVAPNRKQDPGELFDWRWLAACGIGFWTDAGESVAPDEAAARAALEAIGYSPEFGLDVLLTAFQRHFVPSRVTGELDPYTMGRLLAIAEEMGGATLTQSM